MGIMSKGSRLPERPLPPNAEERDEDIQSIDDSDVLFAFGQECLTDYCKASPCTTPTNENTSNTSTLNASTSSTGSQITQDQVKESYSDVMKLLSIYSHLKDVPSELEDKYCNLKNTSDQLTDSISVLRALSLDFGIESSADSNSSVKVSENASDKSTTKGKMKPRKKK